MRRSDGQTFGAFIFDYVSYGIALAAVVDGHLSADVPAGERGFKRGHRADPGDLRADAGVHRVVGGSLCGSCQNSAYQLPDQASDPIAVSPVMLFVSMKNGLPNPLWPVVLSIRRQPVGSGSRLKLPSVPCCRPSKYPSANGGSAVGSSPQ